MEPIYLLKGPIDRPEVFFRADSEPIARRLIGLLEKTHPDQVGGLSVRYVQDEDEAILLDDALAFVEQAAECTDGDFGTLPFMVSAEQKQLVAFYWSCERWERAIREREGETEKKEQHTIRSTGHGSETTHELEETSMASESADARNVFVVHGRNMKARDAMFSFLRALGLNPLEWDEAVHLTGKSTPYVGEVLDAAFKAASAVVVILTGDDEARLLREFQGGSEPEHERKYTPQPRLNVVLEAGMALGSHADRTIIVELEKTRPFSDILGRHTVRFDGSASARNTLKTRLSGIGCKIKEIGGDWLKEGDFEGASRHPS